MHDLCGFLLHAIGNLIRRSTDDCPDCWKSIPTSKDLLPTDFYDSTFVSLGDLGGLKYCSPSISAVFKCVESILQSHFKSEQAYIADSFDPVIEKISNIHEPLRKNLT